VDKEEIQDLISKVFSGTASEAEQEKLNTWYRQQNEQDVYWPDSLPNEQAEVKKRMLNNLHQHIHRNHMPVQRNKPYRKVVAALAMGLILFTGGYYLFNNKAVNRKVAAVHFSAPQNLNENRYVYLPDSSVVVLRQGSTISYIYNGHTRELQLSGEAYFDVRHQQDHPFIVHTGNLITTVLGTSFNIKALPGKAVTVSVTRGKVSVMDKALHKLSILTPNQQVVYSPAVKSMTPQVVQATGLVEWAKTDMQFSDMPYGQLAERLSRRYGVEIEFKNPAVKNCLITGRFTGTEPLEQVLQIISQTMGTTYLTNGNKITIDGNGCS